MTDLDLLLSQIADNPELFDVVSRHGLTEEDLLGALSNLRDQGRLPPDLWTLVTHAARMKKLGADPAVDSPIRRA